MNGPQIAYLAENEWSFALFLALDILVGPQSHSLPETGHEEGIGYSQQGEILAEVELVGV